MYEGTYGGYYENRIVVRDYTQHSQKCELYATQAASAEAVKSIENIRCVTHVAQVKDTLYVSFGEAYAQKEMRDAIHQITKLLTSDFGWADGSSAFEIVERSLMGPDEILLRVLPVPSTEDLRKALERWVESCGYPVDWQASMTLRVPGTSQPITVELQ